MERDRRSRHAMALLAWTVAALASVARAEEGRAPGRATDRVNVRVIVDGSRLVRLYLNPEPQTTQYVIPGIAVLSLVQEERELLCDAPCTALVPRTGVFLFDAPGIVSSSRFRLPRGVDSVLATVSAGSLSGRIIAATFLGAGLAFVAAGAGFYGWAAHLDDLYRNTPWFLPSKFDPAEIEGQRTVALGLVVSGALTTALGVVGVVLTRTSYDIAPAPTSAVAFGPDGLRF